MEQAIIWREIRSSRLWTSLELGSVGGGHHCPSIILTIPVGNYFCPFFSCLQEAILKPGDDVPSTGWRISLRMSKPPRQLWLRPRTDKRRTSSFLRDESLVILTYFSSWYRQQCPLSHCRSKTPFHREVYVSTVTCLGQRWDNEHCQQKIHGKEGPWCSTYAC